MEYGKSPLDDGRHDNIGVVWPDNGRCLLGYDEGLRTESASLNMNPNLLYVYYGSEQSSPAKNGTLSQGWITLEQGTSRGRKGGSRRLIHSSVALSHGSRSHGIGIRTD